MKKNERPGLTMCQRKKILREAMNLTGKGEEKFSRADLKDFREIVNKIEKQTYNIGESNPKKISPNRTIAKTSNIRLAQPVPLKQNRLPQKTPLPTIEEDKPAVKTTPLAKPFIEKPREMPEPADLPID